ncbi:proton channel OTOP2-like [Clavelina lepadiformis]|uniref:proton channel OTOP2-like n=1 Tax=Clavelina lepadiformis TaxID=159417 RepID=UPI004042C429
MEFEMTPPQSQISTVFGIESNQIAREKHRKLRLRERRKKRTVSESVSEVLTRRRIKYKRGFVDDISNILSLLYGIFIIGLTFVFKTSEIITSKATREISRSYLEFILSVSVLWMIAFKIYSTCKRKEFSGEIQHEIFINRWLTGVVSIFGITVVVKTVLEFIAVLQISNPQCNEKVSYGILFALDAIHVVLLIEFLFRHGKRFIDALPHQNRFWTMHLMATSLAVWLSTVVDEVTHALHDDDYSQTDSGNYTDRGLFYGKCRCTTDFCLVVSKAELFLSPILVEFSLVTTCLLYEIWRNVRRALHHDHSTKKRNYNITKTYQGIFVGASVFVATVVMIVFLELTQSDSKTRNYYQEIEQLRMYEAFLVACNAVIIVACILGFIIYFLWQSSKDKKFTANLDVVLFFICLVALIIVNIFSIFSVGIGGPTNGSDGWILSLINPLIDIIANLIQVLFIMCGLQASGCPSSCKEKKKSVTLPPQTYDNQTFGDFERHISSSTMIERKPVSVLFTLKTKSLSAPDLSSVETLNAKEPLNEKNLPLDDTKAATTIASDDDTSFDDRISDFDDSIDSCSTRHTCTKRILRNIVVCLVFTNASLWILLSLNGTVFTIYPYQDLFYGREAWTTITSIAKPLSVFLRMHAAACLFEIWYFS